MSFLDKIKNLFEDRPEPEPEKISHINLSELPAKVESLMNNRQEWNQKLKKQLKERISKFEKESGSAIKSLANIDLSKRKEYERIKLIVQDNLNLYAARIGNLGKDLAEIEEPYSFDYIKRIFSAINEFARLSNLSYEKATYLVGEEMAAIKKEVKRFAQDIGAIAEENKLLFEEAKTADNVFKLFNELRQSEALSDDIRNEIARLNLKIKEQDDKYKGIKAEIVRIKESEEHKKDSRKRENYQKEQFHLSKEMEKIRKGIDFKALARAFHYDHKKASIIKSYADDFKSALKADEKLWIIEMVESSQNVDVSFLRQIKDSLIKSDSPIVLETEVKISSLSDELKGLELEKAAAESAILEQNKKQNRIARKKEKALSELKQLLTSLRIAIND